MTTPTEADVVSGVGERTDTRLRAWHPVPKAVMPPPPTTHRWALFSATRGALTTAVGGWSRPHGPAGVLAVLPGVLDLRGVGTLLHAITRSVRDDRRLVLVHTGAGGASLLQTLALEEGLACLTIEVAPTRAAVAAAEAFASTPIDNVSEVAIDARGRAFVTTWTARHLPWGRAPVWPGERVLVTGGLGGLGIRVSQLLAERLHAHPVLLDSVDRSSERARRGLGQLRGSGWRHTYLQVDLCDVAATAAALARVRPAAVIHCAGVIEGGPVRSLRAQQVQRVIAPKVAGLRAVLAATDLCRLRAVLAFGSVLARFPHRNVGAYALANEALRREVHRWASARSGPRYVTAEWSVWDGAGVAADSGAVAVARSAGYLPIDLADGLAAVERLLAGTDPGTSVVVSQSLPSRRPERRPTQAPEEPAEQGRAAAG